jgi:hypothetical protein
MAEYTCPHCKKTVYDDEALLCLYCGESLQRAIGVMGKLRYSRPAIIITIVVVIVLLSFLLLMLR